MGSFGNPNAKKSKGKKKFQDPYAKQKKAENAKEQAKYAERQKKLEMLQAESEKLDPEEFVKRYSTQLDEFGIPVPELETHRGGEQPSTWAKLMDALNTGASTSVGWQSGGLKEEDSTAKNVGKWLGRGLLAVGTLGTSEALSAAMPNDPMGTRESAKNAIKAALHKEHFTGDEFMGKYMHMEPGIARTAAGLTQEIATDPLTYANVGSLTKAGKAAKATPAMIKGIDTTADALKAVDAVSDTGRELSALNTVLKAAEAGDKTADTASAIGRINEIAKSFAKQGDVVGKGVAKDLKHIAKTTDNLTPSLVTRAAKGDNAISLGSNWGKQASMGQRAALSLGGRPLIQGGKALEGAEKATKALKGMKAFNAASNTAKAANISTEAAGKVKGILSSADDAVRFGKKGAVKAFDDALAPVLERVKAAGDDVDEFLKGVTDKYENPWTVADAGDGVKTPILKATTADENEAISLIEKTMGDLRAAEVSEGINTPLLAEAKEVVDPEEIVSMVEEGKPFRYLPHRLSAEEIEAAKATKGKALLAGDDFTKTRKLRQSVEGLEEGGINPFEKNAGVASKKRIAESVKAVENQRMMQGFGEIVDEAGRPLAQRAEDMEHIKEFAKGTTGDMTEKWVPKMEEGQKVVKVGGVDWVVDSALADDMERVFTRMKEAEGAGKVFDKLTDAWRVTATILNPGFHARNAYSNWWNIYLGYGLEGLDPRRHHLTRDVLLRMKDKRSIGDFLAGNPAKALGDLADQVIHTKSGRAISVLEFAEEAAKRGALDVGYMGLADEAVLKAGKSMANPVRWGRAAGTRVEGHARLTAFLNGVIETGDFDEAASLMKKYLFDYGDLSPFEKQLRRYVPFYTWTRKNLPLQLSQIIQQPGKYAGVGKVMRASQQAAGLDETNTPGYFSDLAAFPIPGLKFNGVPQFLNPNLPFQDLQKIPFPTNGWAGLNNTAQEAIGMVNPLIKGAVELSTKKENFLNRELYPTPGKKVQVNPIIGDLMKIPGVGDLLKKVMRAEEINSYWDENKRVMGVSPNADYLTRQIPFLANVGKWTGAEETPPGKYLPNLLTTLAGIKVMPYDQPLEKEKVAWENKQRLVDKMSELEKQQGINLPSLASTEDYLQYQAARPLMDKVDFAASKGIEDAGSADTQKAYIDYLRGEAGVSGPLDVDEVNALNTAVKRKEKYLPSSDNIERYLRYLAGTPTYTQATHSKIKKLDNDTPEAATAYMKYLMSEAGVTGKLDMDDYSAFQLAYWLGQAEVPPAKKAPAAKKKKKKKTTRI